MTLRPASASVIAAASPLGPLPMTIASALIRAGYPDTALGAHAVAARPDRDARAQDGYCQEVARNTTHVDLAPEAVWEVLADPRMLANWVVGASRTRGMDGDWPQPGTVVHHSQMMVINDSTSVVASEPPRRLVLEARARPVAIMHVEVHLEPEAGGTRIVIEEWPIGGLVAHLPRGLAHVGIHLRNRESVRRMRWLAEIGARLAAHA